MSVPGGSDGKEFAWNTGDLGLIPGMGRSPGEGNGYPLHFPTHSGLENSMDCIVHGVAKSWTWLSNFHTFHTENRLVETVWEAKDGTIEAVALKHILYDV